MNPLMIGLAGMGLLGGWLGGKGRKPISPEELARLFGPGVLAGDTEAIYRMLAASPEMAGLINSSYAQGNTLAANLRQNLARSGLGGSSGIGAILSAAAPTYGRTLHLNALASLWQNALQAAQGNLANRMNLFGQGQLAYQGTPTPAQQIGSALTGMASMGLTSLAGSPRTQSAAQYAPYPPGMAPNWWTPVDELLPRPVVGSGGTIIGKPFGPGSWGV